MLAHLRNRGILGQRNACGIDIPLPATVTAVDPQQLANRDQGGEPNRPSGRCLACHRVSLVSVVSVGV